MNTRIDQLKRYFNNKYSRDDYLFLREMTFKEDAELREMLGEHWEEFKDQSLNDGKNLDGVLRRLNKEIDTRQEIPKRKSIISIFSRIAAILLVPLLIALGILYKQFDKYLLQKDVFVEISSPMGARTVMNLPDGSTVWLNGGSSIRYPAVFSENRKVRIEGEAFFKVHSDKLHPFLVGADNVFVKATGTEFNVWAYKDEPEVKIILKEGKVSVLDENDQPLKEMQSGHQLTIKKGTTSFDYSPMNVESYSDWINGKLVFQNAPMAEVLNRMEHWFGVDIEVVDKELYNLHFKATFVNETIEEAFKLLQITETFDYQFLRRKQNKDGSFTKPKILITKNKPM